MIDWPKGDKSHFLQHLPRRLCYDGDAYAHTGRARGREEMLQREFQLDNAALEDLKEELICGQRLAVDEDGRVLVRSGAPAC
jgi:hypothetical protein